MQRGGSCDGWARTTTVAERAALVRRVAELHTERKDELAKIIVREMGKPIEDAIGEVEFSAAIYEYYADNAEDLLADEPIALLDGEGDALIRRSPFGVLLGIMPWNFPYYQVARFAGPNLCIGNTILLKHAPQCPESAAAIQQIFDDAGFPEGAYVNVYATNEQAADIIADPRVAGVSLTGSARAGAAVAEIAGRNLKKVVLELGGSDPFILLSTDDLDAVVEQGVTARMDNTGQSCNAAKRFIVADDLYDEFVEKFTASVLAHADGISPLSSLAAAERLQEQVDRAVAQGASLVPPASAKARTSRPGCSPTSPPTTTSSTRSCSARWRWCSRPRLRRKPSPWRTTPPSASARTCSPPTTSRRRAWPTRSTRAWCSSTVCCWTVQSFPSVASRAPASVGSWAATGSTSSSTRS